MLTKRQAEAHRFIFDYMRENGECPSYDEMSKGLDSTCSTVASFIDGLEERGFITRIPNMARSITLLKNPPLHHVAYFKAEYDLIEELTELVPLEESHATTS